MRPSVEGYSHTQESMAYVLSYSVTTKQEIQKETEDRVFTSAAMCQ